MVLRICIVLLLISSVFAILSFSWVDTRLTGGLLLLALGFASISCEAAWVKLSHMLVFSGWPLLLSLLVSVWILVYLAEASKRIFLLPPAVVNVAAVPQEMRPVTGDALETLETLSQSLAHHFSSYGDHWRFIPPFFALILLVLVLAALVWIHVKELIRSGRTNPQRGNSSPTPVDADDWRLTAEEVERALPKSQSVPLFQLKFPDFGWLFNRNSMRVSPLPQNGMS